MKITILSLLLTLLPLMASADASTTRTMSNTIEGIYQVQPDSYRSYNDYKTYGNSYEIMIFKNGDGTYYVDDLFGGWYSQRAGYGKNYAMTGNIAIADDGTVSLNDSHIIGWGDSLDALKGTYNSTTSTFMIVAEYAGSIEFHQTWIKIEDLYSGDKNAIEKDGIYYKLNNLKNEASISFNPNYYSGDIIIPEKVEHNGVDYRVTEIADSAFYLCIKLNSILIPKSISSIGKSSFRECENLTSIEIPNSVITIGDSAFYDCRKLTSVTLPNQLERIGNGVFYDCCSFSSIVIPSSVKSIGNGAFYGCYVQSLDLPGSIVAIGNQAFARNNLIKLEIPNGIETIGDGAFESSYYLTHIDIPSSITSIGRNAFADSYEIVSVNIDDLLKWCNTEIKSEIFTNYIQFFLNDKEIQDLVIPNGVLKVGKYNFCGCRSLRTVTISNDVKEIADSAFCNCTNLQSLSILNDIDSIGKYSFYNCTNLETVLLPDVMTKIGEKAFYGCTNLSSLKLPKNVLYIEAGAFNGCSAIPELIIPEGIKSVGNGAFNGCNGIKTLHIPSSLTFIDYGAFSGCNGLTSITVANGNMVYDSRYDCNAIIETATNTMWVGCKNSTVPYSVKVIAPSAFSGCQSLTNITIPQTVTEILDRTFSGCSGLKTINIPNSVTRIGESAFWRCTSLTTIDIPNSVSYLGKNAFEGCSSLSSIEIPNSVTSISWRLFQYCTGLTSVIIPNSVTEIGLEAFSGCTELKSISIPNSVTSIESYAFANCYALTNVFIPNSIIEIQNTTFYNCKQLESVFIPSSIKQIDSNAFTACNALTNVYCLSDDVPNVNSNSFPFFTIIDKTTLHVPASSIEKYKTSNVWKDFNNIVALTDEELALYQEDSDADIENNESIEGVYQTQSDSYRIYNGNKVSYGNTYEFMITENGDGTYFVDDLVGGWYCQRADFWGYGPDYCMTGNIKIAADCTVSLIDSHVIGWDDGLVSLTGTYDSDGFTFKTEAEYVSNMKFYQTWVKVANGFKLDGIYYKICGKNTVSVMRGNYSGDIVIPEQVLFKGKTYTVTSIDGAFNKCKHLTSVSIPSGVTSIGYMTFYECTELTSVTIPNSVVSIDDRAFYGCTCLKSITIPNSVTSIGDNVFVNCTSLTSVSIPNSVTSIGDWAFFYCINLKDLILPDNITTIGELAFNENYSLKSINIPKSVLKIGDSAFSWCNGLETIKVDEENVKYDSRDNCNAIIETYSNTLIKGCKSTVIPQDIRKIGKSAFDYCVDLKELNIPNSVTSIEQGAFWKCTGLESFRIGNNVKDIGRSAFSECEALKSVIIPNNVSNIQSEAFYHCNNLQDVYCYAETIPTTNVEAFNETPIVSATLHVPAASIDKYRQTAPWSGFGKIVALTPEEMGIDGDVNGDNVLDEKDLNAIANHIMGKPQEGYFDINLADVNKDRKVDAADIVKLVNMIRNK